MRKSKICLGCLRMIDSSEKGCPFCGFEPSESKDKKMLPAGILLYHRYYVGKVLGEGGFGITYTGYDISEKRPVAIKEYFPANIAQRNMSQENPNAVIPLDGDNGNIYARGLERFAQEAKILKKLKNLSHVVKVYDYFLQNNTGYLIMEYVPGMTLRKYVCENGCFSYHDMFSILKPVMKDLSMIHEMGMIHRDLSPDNIILQANGVAKVIDFGTTRAILQKEDGTNKTMTVMLRQQYAPKEQYLPNGNIGAWSDVYSLCATIYFMLLGTEPKNVFEREAKDIEKAFADTNVNCDTRIVRILEKGMSVTVSKRYQSVIELQEALETVESGTKNDKSSQEHTIYIDRENNKKKLYFRYKIEHCLKIGVLGVVLITLLFIGIKRFYHRETPENHVENIAQTSTPAASPEVKKILKDTKKLVIVPDVKNKSEKEAYRLLHIVDSELIIVVEKQYNIKVKKGRVITQSLPGGKSYRKKGEREIVLTISKGKREEKKATMQPETTKTAPVVTKKPPAISVPEKTKKPVVTVVPKKKEKTKKNIKIITQD